jgi:hypothetical protein
MVRGSNGKVIGQVSSQRHRRMDQCNGHKKTALAKSQRRFSEAHLNPQLLTKDARWWLIKPTFL